METLKGTIKRLFAVALSFAIVFAMIPAFSVTSFAAEPEKNVIPNPNRGTIIIKQDDDGNKYITGVNPVPCKVGTLLSHLETRNTNYVVVKDGKELAKTEYVSTGCVVNSVNPDNHSEVYDSATVLIYGDVVADGVIDAFDAVEIDIAINRGHQISALAKMASDVDGDGLELTTADYAMAVDSVFCRKTVNQVRYEAPKATVTAKGPQTVASDIGEVKLNSSYLFQATETPEEVENSPYKDWKVDLIGTIIGDDIPENAVVFAGQTAGYNNGNWHGVVSPAVQSGNPASLSAVMGKNLTYKDICNDYSEFQCGVGALVGSFSSMLELELRLVNPADETQHIVISVVKMPISHPDVIVNENGSQVVASDIGSLQLDSSCTFKAVESAADAANSPYKNWNVDVIGTVVGADIPAGAVVFAGQTNELGADWVTRTSPALANNDSASLSAVMNQKLTYEQICKDFREINVGVADISDSVNATLKLELILINPDDPSQHISVTTVEMQIGHPMATVTDSGAQVIATGDTKTALSSTYTFTATEDAAAVENSPYKDWKVDIYGTVDGQIPENTVVFAGQTANYDGGAWVAKTSPAVANGQSASLSAVMNKNFTYKDICTTYREFQCGVGVIGNAEVNATLTLEVRLVNNANENEHIVVATVKMPINGNPKADIQDKGPQVVESKAGKVTLDSTCTFKAVESAADVANSPYKNWNVDIYGTVVGADIPANSVVFAGQTANYNNGDWYSQVSPAVASGTSANLSAVMNQKLTYEQICTKFREINVGVGALTSDVNSKIQLELRLVNPDDTSQYITVSTIEMKIGTPKAEVAVDGPKEITTKEGTTYKLDSACTFKAVEEAADVANSPYKNWNVDVYGTVVGADIPAGAVVFAGQTAEYNGGEWYGQVSPSIRNGQSASLSSVMNQKLTYEEICTKFREINVGVADISDSVNATLKLELRLVNPADASQYITVTTVEMPIGHPIATVTDSGAQVIKTGETATALSSTYTFTATEDAAAVENSPYKDWKVDIYGTVDGQIPANTVVFAGQTANYDGGAWVAKTSPAVANGQSASLTALLNKNFTYKDICTTYNEFQCGVGVIGNEEVNATLTLEVRLINPANEKQYITVSTVKMPINGNPKADIQDKGPQVVESKESKITLDSTCTFKAVESAADVANSPYKNWNVDIYGTVVGADIPANSVVLAGQTAEYNNGDWYGRVAPSLSTGTHANLSAVMDQKLTYEQICTSYREINVGVGALTNDVNSKIRLELRLVNPADDNQYITVSTIEMSIGRPEATATPSGAQVITAGDTKTALSSTYTFTATEDAAAVENSPYKDWEVDIYGTVNGSIPENAVVFAGQTANYDGGAWVAKTSPALTNASASLSAVMNKNFTYKDICTTYSKFQCGVGVIGNAEVDATLTLEVRLVNPTDDNQYITVSKVEMPIKGCPKATVTDSGAQVIKTGETKTALTSTYTFTATEDAAAVENSPYKDWKVDLYGTVNGEIPAKTVVFAGQTANYNNGDWYAQVSPSLASGTSASLSAVMGENGTYKDICTKFKEIKCGVGVIGNEKVDATLTLEVRLVNPADKNQYITVSTVEMPIKGCPEAKADVAETPMDITTKEGETYQLNSTCTFKAVESAADVANSPYKNWKVDIRGTVSGADIPAGAVAFAGQTAKYNDGEWYAQVSPSLSSGTSANLSAVMNKELTYEQICTDFREINVGVADINNNLNATLKLELRLVNPADTSQYITVTTVDMPI